MGTCLLVSMSPFRFKDYFDLLSCQKNDTLSHSSNTPECPHGAAGSRSLPGHYTPANPVRWLRTYSVQPHILPWYNRWRSYCHLDI